MVALMRLVWNGQPDRHGGQPSAPGAVHEDEARVAVMTTAVVLVHRFTAALAQRRSEVGQVDPAHLTVE